MTHVVVVGGGIAGLAAASALSAAGLRVTLIDGARQVGGKLRTSSLAGVPVEEGAESFLLRAPEARRLAESVGLGDEVVSPATTEAGLLVAGRVRPLPPRTLFGVPSSVRSLHGVLGPAALARAALDEVLPGTPPDGDESVGALVRRRLGPAVVDRLVDPLLGGVYAGRADLLSVRATVPQLAAAAGSLVRTVRATLPPPAPNGARPPVFGTIRAGLARLPAALAARSGAELVLGRLVRRVERTATGFRVVHGPTVDERAVDADAVVVAVPAAPAARLLRDVAPVAAAELAGVEYASIALVTTAWPAGALRTGGRSGYLVPAVEGRPVKAVTFVSDKWPHPAAAGVQLVRCSIGRYGEEQTLQRDDDDLVADAVAELRASAGARGRPVAARVTRWGGGLPQYAVGHVDRVARIRAAVAAVPGLAVAGAAYDGVGIPACIRTGEAAAAKVLAEATMDA